MSNNILTNRLNSETLPASDIFFLTKNHPIEIKSDTSTYFHNVISFGFEQENNPISFYAAYKVLPLLNNSYLSLYLRKLPFNYRIYSSEGTYTNKESWNFNLNLNILDEFDSENNDSIMEVSLINIDRIASNHSFLTQLMKKDNEVDDISGMKDIFLKIDELIDIQDYNSIDDLITSFISLDFSFQFHISLLASTLKIKQTLGNRIKLFKNAISVGASLMTEEELQLTLQGLD